MQPSDLESDMVPLHHKDSSDGHLVQSLANKLNTCGEKLQEDMSGWYLS